MDSSDPGLSDHRIAVTDENRLLPLPHLTASSILGGSAPGRDTLGHLYATQIASALALRNPQEKRLLVVGMGLSKVDADREAFLQILDLVLSCF